MGIRSDVGVALKEALVKRLETELPEVLNWLSLLADSWLSHDGHQLFVFTDQKWPGTMGGNEMQENLYRFLLRSDVDGDDYLVMEACHQYPEADGENDMGCWDDNPWGLRKEVAVVLHYDCAGSKEL